MENVTATALAVRTEGTEEDWKGCDTAPDKTTEGKEVGTMTTGLAVAPIKAQPAADGLWDEMKPISYEMAMLLDGDTYRKRVGKISAFANVCNGLVDKYKGWIKKTIKTYQGDIRALKDRWKECPVVPGLDGWKNAFARRDKDGNLLPGTGRLFPFSYNYFCQVVKGGRKKALPKAKKEEGTPSANVTVEATPIAYPATVEGWKAFILSLGHDGVRMVLEAAKMAAGEDASAKSAETHAGALAKMKAMLDAAPHESVGCDEMMKAMDASKQRVVYLISLGAKQGLWVKWGIYIATPKRMEEIWQQARATKETAKEKRNEAARKAAATKKAKAQPTVAEGEYPELGRKRQEAAAKGKATKLRNERLGRIEKHLASCCEGNPPREWARTPEDIRTFIRHGGETTLPLEDVKELLRLGAEKKMWFLLDDGRAMLNDPASVAEATEWGNEIETPGRGVAAESDRAV
jgi:hypothetical protein